MRAKTPPVFKLPRHFWLELIRVCLMTPYSPYHSQMEITFLTFVQCNIRAAAYIPNSTGTRNILQSYYCTSLPESRPMILYIPEFSLGTCYQWIWAVHCRPLLCNNLFCAPPYHPLRFEWRYHASGEIGRNSSLWMPYHCVC